MKNSLSIIFILFALAFYSEQTNAQILQGEWRDHLSYYQCSQIAEVGDVIYCAAEAGILAYNKKLDEIRKHSKASGLSDIKVSTIAYSKATDKLIIGYVNGNIDIITLSDGSLTNLADIKRKSITGLKSINRIFTYNDLAYLSCSFGIVVLDLNKKEIKDSYLFGEGGTTILVYDLTIIDNIIYAATETGIYFADLNSPNLVDFNYWSRLTFIPLYTNEYSTIEFHDDKIFAVYHDPVSDKDRIITIQNNNYQEFNGQYEEIIYDITSSNGYLGIGGQGKGLVYAPDGSIFMEFTSYITFQIVVDSEQNVFVASIYSGFIKKVINQGTSLLYVNGPKDNVVSKVETKGDRIWVGSGSPKNWYSRGAAYTFIENEWTSFTAEDMPDGLPLSNTYKFAIDPHDNDHVFAGSLRQGFLEFRNNEVVDFIVKDDLEIFNDISDVVNLRPVGIQYDNQGNLYILLDIVSRPLVILDNAGNWKRPLISNPLLQKDGLLFSDLLVTSEGQIWICTEREGIVVLENDGAGNYYSNSFAITNQDGNTISKAFCLEEDNEGNVWVGTNNGPIVYYSPSYIIDALEVIGNQVKIPRNDGTEIVDYLLQGEEIMDIQTDGANRKWFGTANSGAFLISEDGMKTLLNFREDNSPIFSNTVSGIGINEKDGEVFFATNHGLISYKGSATKGFAEYTDVYVYPNPVRPDYDGIITITGLVENSIVKITDVSGNLVYETLSLGGQAIWDGKNFDGHRVASGVYLVFLATEDGGKSHMTKLLFLH